MKKTLVATVALAVLYPAIACAATTHSVAFEKLPAPVKSAIESYAPDQGANDISSHLLKDGQTLVEFSRLGKTFQITVSPKGQIGQVMETVSYKPMAKSARNEAIGNVASLHEDITEFALAGSTSDVQEKLAAISSGLSGIRDQVGEQTFLEAGTNLKAMEEAFAAGNMDGVAIAAVDNFRILEQALDPAALIAPLGVSMLDYTGFKLSTIAGSANQDWALAGKTVHESSGYWKALEPQIGSKGLRDIMISIHDGLVTALKEKDASQLAFGAKMELDAVDLLESYFGDSYKLAKGAMPVLDDPAMAN